jgi:hypothetical protein
LPGAFIATRSVKPDGLAVFFYIPLFIVIVGSGALYATTVIALIAAFSTGSNGEYPTMDNATPIVVDYSMDPTVEIVQYDMMSRKKIQSLIVLG